MKNIKMKNPNLCCIVLYLPVILITLLGFVAMLVFSEEIGVPCFFVAIVLDLVYLIKNFAEIMSISLIAEQVSNWQKTRLWFALGDENEKAEDVAQRIIAKCKKHGKEKQIKTNCPELISVRYKRYRSWMIDVAASEKIVLLYRTDYLDNNTYNNIMSSAKSAVKEMKCKVKDLKLLEKEQKKAPVITATAVIIIAEYMDFNLQEKVRKTPNFNDTAIIPCAVDLLAKRCYFDGMRDISLGGSTPVKNRTIKLIIKTVFNGKLPIENNENYDYDLIDRKLPETTLAELYRNFKKADAENFADTKRMGKSLGDGDVQFKDDFLYLKHGERLAVFSVFEDEDNPSVVEIGTDEFWRYPKRAKISNNDKKLLKKRTEKFFKDKQVSFLDDETK